LEVVDVEKRNPGTKREKGEVYIDVQQDREH
jgi:hypothetical protein